MLLRTAHVVMWTLVIPLLSACHHKKSVAVGEACGRSDETCADGTGRCITVSYRQVGGGLDAHRQCFLACHSGSCPDDFWPNENGIDACYCDASPGVDLTSVHWK